MKAQAFREAEVSSIHSVQVLPCLLFTYNVVTTSALGFMPGSDSGVYGFLCWPGWRCTWPALPFISVVLLLLHRVDSKKRGET